MYFFGFFAIVRSALAVILIRTNESVPSSYIRFVIRFGRKRLFVRRFEWDTLCPDFGLAPVSWQTLDIIS